MVLALRRRRANGPNRPPPLHLPDRPRHDQRRLARARLRPRRRQVVRPPPSLRLLRRGTRVHLVVRQAQQAPRPHQREGGRRGHRDRPLPVHLGARSGERQSPPEDSALDLLRAVLGALRALEGGHHEGRGGGCGAETSRGEGGAVRPAGALLRPVDVPAVRRLVPGGVPLRAHVGPHRDADAPVRGHVRRLPARLGHGAVHVHPQRRHDQPLLRVAVGRHAVPAGAPSLPLHAPIQVPVVETHPCQIRRGEQHPGRVQGVRGV
mmetsp:Transcript_34674/g.70785  ORF Transcript_34674/g.70785 Transcript_34674/m.70785 type:complete len:264 (+) Transcript_34674:276-1067(+)